MQIVTVPHPTLRQTAQTVGAVTPQLKHLVRELADTLMNQTQPRGVGLAAPQVDQSLRIFATYLAAKDGLKNDILNTKNDLKTHPNKNQIAVYVNPRITKHSPKKIFGPPNQDPVLEGCLSIPKLYGPVPRWEWIELEYEQLGPDNDSWQTTSILVEEFYARVIQHELDHLEGILFTDYSLEFDLPVYQEDPETGKLAELENRQILEIF